jgi:ParB family chromosome partitioning protein
MFLLMPHRNNRQMRVVRLDAKANKRKIADTFDGKSRPRPSSVVNALYEPANRYNEGRVSAHSVRQRLGQADVLLVRRTRHGGCRLKPIVGNYLAASQARILEAVREARRAVGAAHRPPQERRHDREAERLLDSTGWLPEPLRLVDVDATGMTPR